MPLELTGRIVEIQEPETGTSAAGKNWIKQVFVIHYGDEIEKDTAFTVMREAAMAQLDRCAVGDSVKVAFSATSAQGRSASTQGRWFTDLNAFRIENLSYPNGHPQTTQTAKPVVQTPHPVQQEAAYTPASTDAASPKRKSAVEQPSESFNSDDSDLPF